MTIQKRLRVVCLQEHETIITDRNLVNCPECGEHVQMGWKVENAGAVIAQDTKNRTFGVVLERFDRVEFYHGIAEMGYGDKPAFAANWNELKRLGNWMERYFGCELLWSDEWISCSDCGKALRTTPDCYPWEPSYMRASDGEILCIECVENDPADVIDEYINRTTHAAPSWLFDHLEQAGFVCYSPDKYCQRFETGFHPGQNDDPREVARDIEENLPNHDYIFKIDSCGQFDLHWSVWLRKRGD